MALGKREAMIYSLVTVNNVTSIEQIASTLAIKPEKAQKIIQNMINTSNTVLDFVNDALLFKNAQNDHLNKKIVLDPNSKNIKKTLFKNPFAKQAPQEVPQEAIVQTKVVACKGCGAENTVTEGIVAECPYCGASVN